MRVFLAACSFVVEILSAGCSVRDTTGPWSSAEARINAAFPLADPVKNNHAWLMEATTGDQKKSIAASLESRLKLRALNCAQGYTPSLFVSADDLRKKLGGTSCFVEADNELSRWTGLLRAGIVLAKPPLKELTKTNPASIVADGFISSAVFASAAPLALLNVGPPSQSIQVLDIETSKPLFREAASSSNIGQLSPNGRLFTIGDAERTRIRDTESGAVVAELPSVRVYTFHWLDARTAIFNRSINGAEKAFLIDFTSGKEVPIPWLTGGMQRAAPALSVENQYVIFSGSAVTKVVLERSGIEPTVSLVGDKQSSGTSWALNASGATANGAHYFASSGNSLKLVKLAALEVESVALDPFVVQLSFPTPDPDKIVVTGFVSPTNGEGPRALLYSISQRTLTPLDLTRITSSRFVYLPVLKRQGVINDRKIELLDAMPVQEELPLARFVADMQDLANQRKMAMFEKQQALSVPGITAQPGLVVPNPSLADLARNAQVEAVGVYQGTPGAPQTPGARRSGYVEVRIRHSTKPLVLVLSSYESVRWMLISERGAQLAAVLVSGYNPSQVIGAGSTRVIMTGQGYAYKQDSGAYEALNREVARVIGKGIGIFQGRYEGGQFSVGGS